MLQFNTQEKTKTRLGILCDFIRTIAVELLRFLCGCRMNVFENWEKGTGNVYIIGKKTLRELRKNNLTLYVVLTTVLRRQQELVGTALVRQ